MKTKYFLMTFIVLLLFSANYANAENGEINKLTSKPIKDAVDNPYVKSQMEMNPLSVLPNNEASPSSGKTLMRTTDGKTVYGYLIYDDVLRDELGVISFNASAPSTFNMIYPNANKYSASAGTVIDGYMYCYIYLNSGFGPEPISFSKINLKTGQETVIADYKSFEDIFVDMTYDYSTKTMYYISTTPSVPASKLGVVNLTNGEITSLGFTETPLSTLACDKNGQLFGISLSGDLCKVNKADGKTSLIGPTGEIPQFLQSMDFDRDSGELYWACCNSYLEGSFAKVNITTGVSTKIGNLGHNAQVTALHIPFVSSPSGSPDVVTNLKITPGASGALSANISFNAPSVAVGGGALSSIDKIEIFRDDRIVKTFMSPAIGSAQTYTDNLTKIDKYIYEIVATNSVGKGMSLYKSVFVGEDVPSAPDNVVLTKSGVTGVLNWSAPTVGINGGWFDAESMTYKIVRNPGATVVAESAKGTTFVDNTINKFSNYSYTIQAKTKFGIGGTTVSNSLGIGNSFQVPYNCTFATTDEFNSWAVVDVNKDATTWTLSDNAVNYTGGRNNADDWLISPPITLKGGKTYRIKFDLRTVVDYETENLKVCYGNNSATEPPTNVLADYNGYANTNYKTMVQVFTPDNAGDYNFGFNIYSDSYTLGVYIRNITVEEVVDNDMAALSITGASFPMVNKEYRYSIAVKNNGVMAQNKYAVELVNGSTVLATTNIEETIASDETKVIVVKWTPTIVGAIDLVGRVVLEGDQTMINNTTTALSIDVQVEGDDELAAIGNGEILNSYTPITFSFMSSFSQTIYLADEIGFNGKIKKITYPCSNKSDIDVNKPIQVYMASTVMTSVADGIIPKSDFTLVYDGNIKILKGNSEVEITLDNEYIYAGGNLCVSVVRPMDTESLYDIEFLSTETSGMPRTHTYCHDVNSFEWDQKGTTRDYIANIKILASTASAGKIQGIVRCNGETVEGVKITTNPLGIQSITNSAGEYTFGYVPVGTYTITTSKRLYEDKTEIDIASIVNQTTTKDIDIVLLSKHNVTGVVKDVDGNDVDGANVIVSGYEEYKTLTNENGEFAFSGVYKANDYNIKVIKKGLATHFGTFSLVDADLVLPEIVLTDNPNPPTRVVATASASKVELTWATPSDPTTFRYDDGTIVTAFGLNSGTANTVFGAVHRVPAILNSVSWYTIGSDIGGGAHKTVNVFIFDIDEAGEPTSTVLFNQMNVPNTDDQWTTFLLPASVNCPNGFMIAISYEGYLGIGVDSGTSEEWPFVYDANYFADDYTSEYFTVLGDGAKFNFTIRAEGIVTTKSNLLNNSKLQNTDGMKSSENMARQFDSSSTITDKITARDGAKSMQGYKIWRFLEDNQDDESTWELITKDAITATAYDDNSWASIPAGAYKYAVKAVYTNEALSSPAFSNMVSKDMEVNVTINVTTNTTTNESNGAIVTLTNNDNKPGHIYQTAVENGQVVINNIWKGVYKVGIRLEGFTPLEVTNVNITEETTTLSYTLNEKILKPFNLVINKTDSETERIFKWNVVESIEDGFEGHDSFTVNSPGQVGWGYIDADGSITNGFSGFQFPNIHNPMAYIVFAPAETDPIMNPEDHPAIQPKEGNKFIASFCAVERANEDYFISPELLFATDFTFSFFAKTYMDKYGLERIKVGYSTEGKEKLDFVNWLTTGDYIEVPVEQWTKYSYTVPSEAKYVVIECVSDQAFILMLDDVFIGNEDSKAFTQYEVYLNEEKVDEVTSNKYKFTSLTEGDYIAGVKAIYTSGITEMSTVPFHVDQVGVASTDSTTKIFVYPNPVRDILNVRGEYQLLEIYNVDGNLVMTSHNSSSDPVAVTQMNVDRLANGVYFIKVYNNGQVGICKFVKQI